MRAAKPHSSKASPADDDSALFREALGGIEPHRAADRVPVARKPPPVAARQSEADERAVLAEMMDGPDPEWFEIGESLHYLAPGVQHSVMRKLKRGNYRVQAELDLHGLNRHKARLEVADFLQECHRDMRRCVRIIHGKGNGSPNSGPILKAHLDSWLRRRKDVVAFCSARPQDGGTGAIYLLLRAPGD